MANHYIPDMDKKKISKEDPLLIILIVFFIIILIVGVGTIGYRVFGNLEWIDAFQNGALVFTATTLVTPVTTYNGIIFSSIYNLVSAVFILVLLGIILKGGLVAFDFTEEVENICCCGKNNKELFRDDDKITNVFDM